MTNTEFTRMIEYLIAGSGKPLPVESRLVYFDLLRDLPFEAGMLAAKRVLAEHRWSTFPTIAELRQAAVETARGEIKALSEAEAWAIAWRVVGDTDPEVDGSFGRACTRHKAPGLVVEAIRTFGLQAFCYGAEAVGIVRAQFRDMFGQLAARERRAALLPPAIHAALDEIRERRALPAAARQALDGIGTNVH